MPRDGIADEVENAIDPLTALPAWVKGEKRLSMMLPYVSLVNDRTIRTRGNELMQCIRLEGVNSTTNEDGHLDRIGGLLAGIVAQVGTEFSFYLHKVSKAVDVTLPPVPGEGFAAAVDERWHAHLGRAGLRDKTLTLTVLKRPEASSRLPFGLGASRARHAADTTRRMRKLDEVVGFLLSSFDELKPRLLAASTGELLGFLGSLNTGEEHPLFPRSRLGVIAEDLANTRVTFRGTTIALSDGAVGDKLGAIFAVKNYPAKTDSLMLDELNLPVDMVVTHSFVPINANIMAGRIKRQLRLMQAANDGAVSLAQELELAQDDLEAKRLIFGEHHMTVPAALDAATDEPTPENVERYFLLQQMALNRSEKFATVAQTVTTGHPMLDEGRRRPRQDRFSKLQEDEASKAKAAVLGKLFETSALILFLDARCSGCALLAENFTRMKDTHGLVWKVVSMDGTVLPASFGVEQTFDNGLADKLGVTAGGAVFLARPPDGFYPVSWNATGAAEIADRVLLVANRAGLITEAEFATTQAVAPMVGEMAAIAPPTADPLLTEADALLKQRGMSLYSQDVSQ